MDVLTSPDVFAALRPLFWPFQLVEVAAAAAALEWMAVHL